MSLTADPGELFFSTLARDPEMAELVSVFVLELPSRLAAIRRAASDGDCPTINRLAHQLKGAGGSYGFAQLSSAAGDLDRAACSHLTFEEVAAALDRLANICNRVRAGRPPLPS
jgi:HPt (histidine-containing phosphotransfer) domain-containing protein